MRLTFLLALLPACAIDSGANTGGGGGKDSGDSTVLIDVQPNPMTISDCDPGFSKSADLTITAAGGGDLTIYEAKIVEDPSDAFSFEELADAIIVAGESGVWPVSAGLPDANPAFATLRIRSDAPASDTINVPLCAFPTGWTGETTCE